MASNQAFWQRGKKKNMKTGNAKKMAVNIKERKIGKCIKDFPVI